MSDTTYEPFTTNTKAVISKGSRALNLTKGTTVYVRDVQSMGAEYSHNVKIVLEICGKSRVLWARHPNRLKDSTLRLNNGNPLNYIEIMRKK